MIQQLKIQPIKWCHVIIFHLTGIQNATAVTRRLPSFCGRNLEEGERNLIWEKEVPRVGLLLHSKLVKVGQTVNSGQIFKFGQRLVKQEVFNCKY